MAFLLLHNLLSIGNLLVSTSESQQDIDESFKQKFMKYGGSVPKQKGIANALVHFIADTMSPLSVVENSHLKLFELIRSKIWTTILKTIVYKTPEQSIYWIRTQTQWSYNIIEIIRLKVDLWSNRQMKGFIGITGHFILICDVSLQTWEKAAAGGWGDTLEFPYDHFPTLGHRYVPYYSVGSKRRLIRKTSQHLKGVIYV